MVLVALTVLFFAVVPAADAFACASEPAAVPQSGQVWSDPTDSSGETAGDAFPGHCPHGTCHHAASLPAVPLAVPTFVMGPSSLKTWSVDATNPSREPHGPERPPRA